MVLGVITKHWEIRETLLDELNIISVMNVDLMFLDLRVSRRWQCGQKYRHDVVPVSCFTDCI